MFDGGNSPCGGFDKSWQVYVCVNKILKFVYEDMFNMSTKTESGYWTFDVKFQTDA